MAVKILALVPILTVLFAGGALAYHDTDADTNSGKAIYNQTCVACHGAEGTGQVPGAPDFTKTGGVLSKPNDVLLKHMENGVQSPGSPMAMPPRGGNPNLSEQDLKAVLAYLHKRFGISHAGRR